MIRNIPDGGEAILEAFRRLHIDYVMASPGSEWGAVWEAFARQDANGAEGPRYLSCAHETLAVNLAMGYALMTGRMQAVMLHTGVGLLQGSMALDAANRAAIPMVVMSGESVTYGELEGFNPGPQWQNMLSVVGGPHNLVNSIVKWSHPVSSLSTMHEQLIRAGEMAQRSPAGPVFMTVPIETMLEEWTPPRDPREVPRATRAQAPREDIERVADLLAGAASPAIVTESIGRDPEGYEALVELADLLAIPVCDSNWADFANFPKDHPLYQGGGAPDWLDETDIVLTIRSRGPWWPPGNRPRRATVVNIDETPLRSHMVHQNLQADIYLEGDAVATLRDLVTALRGRDIDQERVSGRRERWSRAHNAMTSARMAVVDAERKRTKISPIGLCAAMNDVCPDDTIFVGELITHRRVVVKHLAFGTPQSFFATSSGGLGQGLGLALGTRLASGNRPVVSLIGDGSFMYNPVVQSLALSQHEGLPVMIVIFNNGGYSAMQLEHHAFYPDGVAAAKQASHGQPITGFDYADLATPFGFFGRTVEAPDELIPALREGLSAVKDGRSAIVNVILDDSSG